MTQSPENAPLNPAEGTDLAALDQGVYTSLRTARSEARLELDGTWHQISPRYAVSQLLQNALLLVVVIVAAVVLALGFALPLLSQSNRARIDCDALLPIVIWAITATPTFQRGAFLIPIAQDAPRLSSGGTPGLHWSSASPSFNQVTLLASSPLIGSLGAVSTLAAYAAQHARNPGAVLAVAVVACACRCLDGLWPPSPSPSSSSSSSWWLLRYCQFGSSSFLS